MKKCLILPILASLILSGCDLNLFDGFLSFFNKNENPETEQSGENQSENEDEEHTGSEEGGGNEQGGNSEGGENTGGNSQTHNQASQPADVSKWPSEQRKYVTTFLNGLLPYYSAFNSFDTGVVDGSSKPYFNPFVKNTNPVTNYEYEFGDLLRKAGWISEGDETDEDGVLQHYYRYDDLHCQFAKYRANDGIYYFDVYAYNDYEAPLSLPNSKLSLDVESMGLTGKYQNYSKTIGSYTLSGIDIMKQDYDIQLKKDTGKLTIQGPSKGIAFIITRNADALFVKYGSSNSSLKYAFNNGGTFNFDSQANYIEITAESRVVDFETIDVLN